MPSRIDLPHTVIEELFFLNMPHVDDVSKFVASSGVSLKQILRSEHLAGIGAQPATINSCLATSYGVPISGMNSGTIFPVQPIRIEAVADKAIFFMGPNA